jgi:hypothetical protein
MEPSNEFMNAESDGIELLAKLWKECPDMALQILQERIRMNAVDYLESFLGPTQGERFWAEILDTGAVLAGGFILQSLYGKLESHSFGDIDMWIDISDTIKGDPRQLLPENHRLQSLDWSNDAAEISKFYQVFPLQFPYLPNDAEELFPDANKNRFFHPIFPILMRYWWQAHTTPSERDRMAESLKDVKTLDEMRKSTAYEITFWSISTYRPELYSAGLGMWGEREMEPYVPNSYEYDNYENSITNAFTKSDKGIVASRTFTLHHIDDRELSCQVHIVNTQGLGLQKWIEEAFDLNLCGAVQLSSRGLYIREPNHIWPFLLRKLMMYTTKSRMLDWTESRRSKTLAALKEDSAPDATLASTRIGSLNVMKTEERDEWTILAIFEWAKIVLLPPIKEGRRSITMEELYERMSTVKLPRIDKYLRRGFEMYHPVVKTTADEMLKVVLDCKARGFAFAEIVREALKDFESSVDPIVLGRFVGLVTPSPERPWNSPGTGPTYFF